MRRLRLGRIAPVMGLPSLETFRQERQQLVERLEMNFLASVDFLNPANQPSLRQIRIGRQSKYERVSHTSKPTADRESLV
jgi:hypothetical protein